MASQSSRIFSFFSRRTCLAQCGLDKPSSWIWAIISLPETELVTPPEERHCFEALQTAAITDDSSVAVSYTHLTLPTILRV